MKESLKLWIEAIKHALDYYRNWIVVFFIGTLFGGCITVALFIYLIGA